MTNRVYFDGGFYPETGEMFCAVSCADHEHIGYLGAGGTSSTQAEWLAAINALKYAVERSFPDVTFVGDNRNVVCAMTEGWKVKDEFVQYRTEANDLSDKIRTVQWEWIDRGSNLAGHLLDRTKKLRRSGTIGVSQ